MKELILLILAGLFLAFACSLVNVKHDYDKKAELWML